MYKRVPKELKEEALGKVRLGESVKDVADLFGLSTKTIYTWLSADSNPESVSQLKYNKLKKENEELKRIVGILTLDLSREKKS